MRSVEVSLSFVSRKKIHALNKTHRGIDAPTDVLSFPLWTKRELAHLFRSQAARSSAILIGDIVIAPRVAMEKAKSGWYADVIPGKPTQRKVLDFLVGHGMLHVLGHHHR